MLGKFWFLIVLIALSLIAGVALVTAQEPIPHGEMSIQAALGTGITYQGQLKSSGEPVNGNCDFQFSLWDAGSGGAQVGTTQTKTDVSVSNGYFTIPDLDFGSAAFRGDARWLQIAVGCPAGGGRYTILSPRQALTAAPYALSLRPEAVVNGAGGTILSLSGGEVGLDASGSFYAVRGWSASPSGWGVYGLSASNNGRGVVGVAGASSGPTYGVYGRSDSTEGYGVYGLASTSSGSNYGVYGQSDSTAGIGAYGYASSTSGATYGIYGRSNSAYGTGVYGYASSTSGSTYGIYGRSDSPWGVGVYGYVASGSDINIGVAGYSGDGYGVVGSSSSGYAGYFSGRVHVDGNLTVSGGKSFIIDHPLDPASRYLYHFSQEGPEVQNVYNGVIALDPNGGAVVTLPDYFSALNTGPYRYQLTPIGAPMTNLYIAKEIQGIRFEIAGGVPGMKVSWEVTAVRNDPYLRDHPVRAEQVKPVDEQSTYLYPEGYGQPQERGLYYQRYANLIRPRPEALPGMDGE